jgi:chromosome segregation ATPase
MSDLTGPQVLNADRAVAAQPAHAQQRGDADAALRQVTAERDEARRTIADLDARVAALTVQLDHQRSVAANAARERDDYGMRLLHAEQAERRAAAQQEPRTDTAELEELQRRLEQRLAEVENELTSIQRTVSWRVTGPLRSARTVLSRRLGR